MKGSFKTSLPPTDWKRHNPLAGLFGGSFSSELLLIVSKHPNGVRLWDKGSQRYVLENFKSRYNSSVKGSDGEVVTGQGGNPDLLRVGEYYYLGVINSRLNYDELVLGSRSASSLHLIHSIISEDINRFKALIETIYKNPNQKDTEILAIATILAAEKTDPRFMKELLDRKVPLHPHALATAQTIANEKNEYATVDLILLRCCFDISLPRHLNGQKQNLPSIKEIKQLLDNSLYQAFIDSPHKAHYASVRTIGVIALGILGGTTLTATTSLAFAAGAAVTYYLSDTTTKIKVEYTIRTDIKALCDLLRYRFQPPHVTAGYGNQPNYAGEYDQQQGPAAAQHPTQQLTHRQKLEAEREKARQEYAAAINDF